MSRLLPEAVLTNLVQLAEGAVDAYDGSFGNEDDFDMSAALSRALTLVLPLYGDWLRRRIADEIPQFHCPEHDTLINPTLVPDCAGCQRYTAISGARAIILGHDSPNAQTVRAGRVTAESANSGA